MRVKSYDAVVAYVKKGLERSGITAHVESNFETAVGLRKPDLIVEMED